MGELLRPIHYLDFDSVTKFWRPLCALIPVIPAALANTESRLSALVVATTEMGWISACLVLATI